MLSIDNIRVYNKINKLIKLCYNKESNILNGFGTNFSQTWGFINL